MVLDCLYQRPSLLIEVSSAHPTHVNLHACITIPIADWLQIADVRTDTP